MFGVAMCAPIAYLVNRLIEQPILARRRAVEGSTSAMFLFAAASCADQCGLDLLVPLG